jgi:isoleucyl-tRNA synthetase
VGGPDQLIGCPQAVPSWFVNVRMVKEQLLANNKKTYWVPSHVQEKRFHNWLEVRCRGFDRATKQ